jgi:hypothetical protein
MPGGCSDRFIAIVDITVATGSPISFDENQTADQL